MSYGKLLDMTDNITSFALQQFAIEYFDAYVPWYFFIVGASSSGKYHPTFAQGKGGLVRHTTAVCMILEELLQMEPYCKMSDRDKDLARIACLCHDTRKYGTYEDMDKAAFDNHAQLAADAVNEYWQEYFGKSAPRKLRRAIACHMGQWEKTSKARPRTRLDKVVHLADYIASRSFIDIAELKEPRE